MSPIPSLRRMQPEHERLLQLAMPRVRELLLRRGTNRNSVVVVVADPRSVMAPALRPSLAKKHRSVADETTMPIVRVLVDDGDDADEDALHQAIRDYMRQLEEDCVCLLVLDGDDKPVLSALAVPKQDRSQIPRGTR